jgi:hypothetical protein
MEIAIPSYKRSGILKKKTLAFLESEGFPKECITIFVANQEEKEDYEKVLRLDYKIVVGVKGIAQQRLFIRNYYPEGTPILSMDDDIRSIKMLREDLPFKTLVANLFESVLEQKLTTWGIYPVNNLFFCKDRLLIGNFYIIACCYGFINTRDILEYGADGEDYSVKEDCWYSLKRIELDGAVLRYDGACPHTDYYAKGGLSETRTLEKEAEIAQKVVALFPTLSKYVVKKSGHPDVKIHRKIIKKIMFPWT